MGVLSPDLAFGDQSPAADRQSYEIHAGSLESVLQQFARQARITLSYASELVQDFRSPGLQGEYSAVEALDRLLAGSGLVPIPVDENAYVLARSTNTDMQVLPRMTVTAPTRTARAVERIPGAVEVVTADQIKSSGSLFLDDVLRNHANIYISDDGTTLSIRGTNRESTVFLIDGKRIQGEASLRYELNRIAAGQIERIEIVKGPGSVLYGSDAIGGVINVITKQPRTGFGGDIEVQGGLRGGGGAERVSGGLTLSGGVRRTQFSFYANAATRNAYSQRTTGEVTVTGNRVPPSQFGGAASPVRNIADEYVIDEDFRDEADVYNIGGTLVHALTPLLDVGIDLSLMDEHRKMDYINSGRTNTNYVSGTGQAIPAFNVPTRWTDDNRRFDAAGSLRWRPMAALDLKYRIYRSQYDKERSVTVIPWRDLGFDDVAASESADRKTSSTTVTNELIGTWRLTPAHNLLAGAEYHDTSGRRQTGLFAQHEWDPTDRLSIIYGARYDNASIADDDSFTVKAGVVYAVAPALGLRANYAQGFKVPENRDYTVTQINPAGRLMLGAHVVDPSVGKQRHELEPERSETFDVGLMGHLGMVRYELTAFHTTIEDRVVRVTENPLGEDGTDYITFRNVDKARIRGLETAVALSLTKTLRIDLSGTWLEAINRATDLKLTDSPSLIAKAGATWQPIQPLSLNLRLRHIGTRYQDEDNTDKSAAYTLLDVSAGYRPTRWPRMEVFAAIDNLVDSDNDSSLRSDPGRFFRCGIRYGF